jgi:hypothetical protein
MIIDTLKTYLTTAGCSQVFYENEQLANVITDQIAQGNTVGLIIEPSTVTLEVKGNGVTPRYPPITVEILHQVKPEDTGEHNRATLEALLAVAGTFVHLLVRSGLFAKITDIPALKVNENRYDANVIGWSMALNLKEVTNTLTC